VARFRGNVSVAEIRRHSDLTADLPRRWSRSIFRLNLVWANTRSMVTDGVGRAHDQALRRSGTATRHGVRRPSPDGGSCVCRRRVEPARCSRRRQGRPAGRDASSRPCSCRSASISDERHFCGSARRSRRADATRCRISKEKLAARRLWSSTPEATVGHEPGTRVPGGAAASVLLGGRHHGEHQQFAHFRFG
jgi:hypothetical protein